MIYSDAVNRAIYTLCQKLQDDLLHVELQQIGDELLPDFLQELDDKLPSGNTFSDLRELVIDVQNTLSNELADILRATGHMTGPHGFVVLCSEFNSMLKDSFQQVLSGLHSQVTSNLVEIPYKCEAVSARAAQFLLFFEHLLEDLPPCDLFDKDLS